MALSRNASTASPVAFLPVNRKDMQARGWEEIDFLFLSGDAYVDHPSFGHAVISRLLEAEGYRVGMIAQPDWRGTPEARRRILSRMGVPRLGVMISTGVLDSMVNNYTAAGRKRAQDAYSPGGKGGRRPDRALEVYVAMVREAFGDIPVVVGGLEPSLRRFTHYDYWSDALRPGILFDCDADIMVYGAGERSIIEIAALLDRGVPVRKIRSVRNTVVLSTLEDMPGKLREAVASEDRSVVVLPPHDTVSRDRKAFAQAFMMAYREQDPVRGKPVLQMGPDGRYALQNPPQKPLSEKEMDRLYAFPYVRAWHPMYDREGGVPALAEVEFSITSHRGCFGGCTFCAIGFHAGRIIQARSEDSVVAEAEGMTRNPRFKGYIHDVGGPTANFRRPACRFQLEKGACAHRECLYPKPCKHLDTSHEAYLSLLRRVRNVRGVKKVFVRSGVRYDFALLDPSGRFIPELVEHHVSGQLKVAPEHVSGPVLACMGKPGQDVFDAFVRKYRAANEKAGMDQYLVPYFISGHPGATLRDAVELAVYIRKSGTVPEQVQQFIPVPGTLAGAMWWSGYDPRTLEPVHVPRTEKEQAMQRALLQFDDPANRGLVMAALRETGRTDLIGFGPACLIPPRIPGGGRGSGTREGGAVGRGAGTREGGAGGRGAGTREGGAGGRGAGTHEGGAVGRGAGTREGGKTGRGAGSARRKPRTR